MKQYTISALIAALLVVIGMVYVSQSSKLGSNPGQDYYSTQFFHAGMFDGGGILATSTDDTTATFLASDIIRGNTAYSLINFTPNVGSITATLPATSTLKSLVPNAGDARTVMLCNATSTAATPFTLALGTGMNSIVATSSLSINTGDCAMINFYRDSDTDINVFVNTGL